jgi:hypothetical protein
MATATTTFGEFTLTASTPGNASAPITYTLTTPLAGGITFTQSALVSITATPDIGFGPGIQLSDGKAPINLPAGVNPATFIQQLKFAAISLDSDIKFLTTTVAEPTGPSEEFSEAFADLLEEPQPTTDPGNQEDAPDPEPITDDDEEAAASEAELRTEGAAQDQFIFQSRKDWRVRLALSDAPEVNYLYRAANPGILNPLRATNGVLFPYTPTITVNYSANYNPTDLVHNNYKVYQYSSSSVDAINIQCDFTAQDTYEANYLLAVIHFFRSATKMFYGQDENPRRGTPPPLCYIYGMGSYQFAGQPLAIQAFSYNLPNSVDYIKTSVGGNVSSSTTPLTRLDATGAAPGGVLPPANFTPIAEPDTISWVPSKIQLQITCIPMLSRNQVSNRFSLEKYATGELLNGIGKPGGGFW